MNIKRIAELAGVSKASVSRVLNNHPSVSPELRAAVETVVRQEGYEPNAVARALARRRTGNIALVIPRPAQFAFGHAFLTEVMRGVGAALEAQSLGLQIITSAGPASLSAIHRDRSCDGIVFAGIWADDPLARHLDDAVVPVVVVGRPSPQLAVPFVTMDDEEGAYAATRHLLARGHRRLALVNGPASMWSVNRRRGFQRALLEAGLAFDRSLALDGEFSSDSGQRLMAKLLARPERPTGVFLASDVMAYGALAAARQTGLSVPGDLAVAGFDNFPFSALTEPPLTTVDAHAFTLGFRAAGLLLAALRGETPVESQITLPMTLVVRSST
ncbi:MAG: LacI family transcriptional regulator [Chloroflexi bacterium]|nr:LacI family transcriptional regulator [Chloroflexota bacterium]